VGLIVRRDGLPDCLGIDIGRESVKLAVVGRAKTGPVVRAFSTIAYPGPGLDLAARAAFAAQAVADGPHARMSAAVTLSGTDVFLRPLVVPFTKTSHIAKTLKFEMDGELPFDVETAVLDFAAVSAAGKSTRLMVAAMPVETLRRVSEPFEAAGLNIRIITADVLSAPALAAYLGDDDFTLMDVSPSGWKMSVCGRARLHFARAAAAAPTGDRMEPALGAWFKQSLMVNPSDEPTGKVLVVGGLSAALDLVALAEATGSPAERLLLPDAALDESLLAQRDQIAACAMPAVAAATGLATGKSGFDLYAAAHGRVNPLDRVFAPAMGALVLLILLFAVWGWDFTGKLVAQRQRLAGAKSAETALWQGLFPDRQPPGGSVRLGLQSELKALEEGASERALGGKAGPILKALYVVSKTADPAAGLRFEKFTAAQRKGNVTVKATAPEATTAEKLAGAIEAEGTFDAELLNVSQESDRVTFQIVLTPKRGKNVQ